MVKSKPQVHRRSLIWLGLMILVLLVDRFLPGPVFDRYYYHGFFLGWRTFYDYVLGWSPIPSLYLLLVILLYRTYTWFKDRTFGFLFRLSRAIGGIAAVVVLFYVLWAFNYRQQELPDRLGLNLKQVTAEDMHAEFIRASGDLQIIADELPAGLTKRDAIARKIIDEAEIRIQLKAALKTLSLPNQGRVRVRQVWPKGTLLRWSTAGIYIPQTGEGHIDMGLLSVQKPFTMAHEMAHGYGVADERDCNFIAWLACRQSSHPWIRYSGALVYWRYVAAEMEPDIVRARMASFPPVVEESLKLIHDNNRKYPDIMPQLRDLIYSSYLKHHGVEGGLRSYNEVVLFVQHYVKRDTANNGK